MIKTNHWILASLLLLPTSAHGKGIQWLDMHIDDAIKLAKQHQRPLLVDVFASWCGPCQKLDSEVFPDPEVAKEAASFIAVRVDADGAWGKALSKRYHVVGLPTVLFLNSRGEEIDRVFGFQAAPEFLRSMRDFRSGRNTIEAARKLLATKPDDLALRFEVGRRLAIRGEVEDARKLLGRVSTADPENKAGYASKALYTLGKYLYLRGQKSYRTALVTLQGLQKRFPDSDQAKAANYPIARAYHGLGQDDQALASLQALIDAAPQEVGNHNTFAWFCFKEGVDRKRGIQVARQGLAIDPKAAGLWDTLAELYGAEGDISAAIKAIEEAITLKPEDAYFKQQLEKFRALAANNRL